MHFTKSIWSLGLLGLVAANPWPKVSLEDSLIARGDLTLRQEPEDICSIDTCGSEAECLIARDIATPLIGRDDYNAANDTAEEELALLKRDIDRPGAGQLDGWFKANWESGNVVNIPFRPDDDGEWYTARYREFLNKPFKMGIKGMCGCTAVIVTSKKGAYISHHWERPTVIAAFEKHGAPTPGAADGETVFQQDVIEELHDALTCLGFNKNEDKDVQVFIFTKVDTSSRTVKYAPQVDQIKNKVVERIPGLSKGDIKDLPYYTRESVANALDTADGKVIISYDPKAGGGKAGYQVWAGSVYNAGGKIDPATINAPNGEATWEPTEGQR
ncbi:hypothetical protein BN1708_006195 [Verticillium longisporum]|uniref:Uncharacterized protein n=1 Tax=Verticillium longisporum TaxID=100787 RepID=A0A0G4MI45_VERLO|nr:hypothetical protein BN1708_006195 [Verticillium longisporum]